MKRIKKLVAVVLTAVLLSSLLLPVMSFAAYETEPGDHTTFEEFWAEMTNEDGSINWRNLPKALFKLFVFVRIFEVIGEFFRNLFGIGKDEPAAEVTTLPAEDVSAAIA